MEVVCEVNSQQATCWGGIDRHVISRVIQELGPGVSFNIVRVIVSPSELHIDPVLGSGRPIIRVFLFMEEGGLRNLPLKGSKEQDVCA